MVNRIEIVVDPREADSADVMVCLRRTEPLKMPDNLVVACNRCGTAIQHRPHAPAAPEKVCWECIAPQFEREAARGDLTTLITPKTAAELADYFRKRSAH